MRRYVGRPPAGSCDEQRVHAAKLRVQSAQKELDEAKAALKEAEEQAGNEVKRGRRPSLGYHKAWCMERQVG